MTDLMHPKVKAFSAEIANELGLEKSFIQFVMNKSKPLCFDYYAEEYSHGWTCFVPDEVEVACPVWSCNADQTLLCIGKDGYWFAKGYHDDPDINDISKTPQGLLADLFVSLCESEETELALKEGAQASGFRFLDRVFEFIDQEHRDYDESFNIFINEIDELANQPVSDEELARIADYLRIDPDDINMRQIPDDAVEVLKARDLIVLEPFPFSHTYYPCGRRIAKPVSAGGNVLPFERRVFEGVHCDAPLVTLFWRDDKWVTEIMFQMGLDTPTETHPTIDAAIQNIIDLYFGDPERMKQLHQLPYDNPEEVVEKAVSLAKDILNEDMIISEAVQGLADLASYPGTQKDLINPFYRLSRELSNFPVGDVRKLWNSEALAKMDIERERVEAVHRDKITTACKRLICELGAN